MSRSYRKPYEKEGYGSPDKAKRKRRAARAVRNADGVADGGAYKKLYNSWNISDFRFFCPNDKKSHRK